MKQDRSFAIRLDLIEENKSKEKQEVREVKKTGFVWITTLHLEYDKYVCLRHDMKLIYQLFMKKLD